MSPILQPFIAEAIGRLRHEFACAGCNDYDMPDTPENRALWDECQAHNLGVPVDQLKTHRDYYVPSARRGKMFIDDSVLIYALKKATGMLDLKD